MDQIAYLRTNHYLIWIRTAIALCVFSSDFLHSLKDGRWQGRWRRLRNFRLWRVIGFVRNFCRWWRSCQAHLVSDFAVCLVVLVDFCLIFVGIYFALTSSKSLSWIKRLGNLLFIFHNLGNLFRCPRLLHRSHLLQELEPSTARSDTCSFSGLFCSFDLNHKLATM